MLSFFTVDIIWIKAMKQNDCFLSLALRRLPSHCCLKITQCKRLCLQNLHGSPIPRNAPKSIIYTGFPPFPPSMLLRKTTRRKDASPCSEVQPSLQVFAESRGYPWVWQGWARRHAFRHVLCSLRRWRDAHQTWSATFLCCGSKSEQPKSSSSHRQAGSFKL